MEDALDREFNSIHEYSMVLLAAERTNVQEGRRSTMRRVHK